MLSLLNFTLHSFIEFQNSNFQCSSSVLQTLIQNVLKHIFIVANYALPEDESDAVVPMFKDVVFTDLNREEAVKVVELYNKIAKEKGYGKKHEERKMKKFKGGNQRGGFKGKDGRNNNQG